MNIRIKNMHKFIVVGLLCLTQSLYPQEPYNAHAEIFLSAKEHHLQTIADLDLEFLAKSLPDMVFSDINQTYRYLKNYTDNLIDAYEQKYPKSRRLKNYEIGALKNDSDIERALQDRALRLYDYRYKNITA